MSKERPWEAGPFEEWVIDELDFRVKSLSTGIQGQFNGDLPRYAGPRKAWARVFSNGMVEYNNPNLVSDNDNEWGLLLLTGDGVFERYGIDNRSPHGLTKQIYGYNCKLQPKYIESSTRPNVPDPGIISIETEIQKSWFAKAKINWVCHSIEQLKAITPYFLTPLQTVIIEFGWNTFNQQSLINLSNFNEIIDIWDNHYKRYSKYVPLSKGNYEFLIGQVINFEYSINDNIITGVTEIASRQLLYSGFRKDSQENILKGKIIDKDGNLNDEESKFRTKFETLVDTFVNSITSTDNQGNSQISTSEQFLKILKSNTGYEKKYGAKFEKLPDHVFSGRNKQTIKYSAERDFDNNNEKGPKYTWVTMDLLVDVLNGIKNLGDVKDYSQYFFDLNIDDITIGAHDNLISTKPTILIPNANAPKLNSRESARLQKVAQGSVKSKTQAAAAIGTAATIFGTAGAAAFFIPQIYNELGGDILDINENGKPNGYPVLNQSYDVHAPFTNFSFKKDKNVGANCKLAKTAGFLGRVQRQDLDYILNKWGRAEEKNSRENTAIPATDQTFGGTRVSDDLKRGYLKNVYINLSFLKSVLGDPNLKNLKEVYDVICKEINEASCNFWELTVVDAPDQNGKATLKIVDTKGPPDKDYTHKIYKFEYMTNNSIIKKLNFTTTLTNANANQIIFKAGAYDYNTPNQLIDYSNNLNNINSTKPKVVYNDRILKTKASATQTEQNQVTADPKTDPSEFYFKQILKDGPKYDAGFLQVTLYETKTAPVIQRTGGGTTVNYDKYDIVDLVMPYEELVVSMLNDGDLTRNTNIYNSPLRNVEIEVSLLGIAGIKTFEFFRVTNLPPPFNDDVVVFQVTNVTHVINENNWETRLKAQLRPAYNLLTK